MKDDNLPEGVKRFNPNFMDEDDDLLEEDLEDYDDAEDEPEPEEDDEEDEGDY